MGAYPIAESEADLKSVLGDLDALVRRHEGAWAAFLDLHCAAPGGERSASAIGRVLADLVATAKPADCDGWRANVRGLDQFSAALSEHKKILGAIPAR